MAHPFPAYDRAMREFDLSDESARPAAARRVLAELAAAVGRAPAEISYPRDADGRPVEPPPEADDERPPELPDQSGTFRAPE